jgi:drug/metabolite transporter (DMT)-like permease
MPRLSFSELLAGRVGEAAALATAVCWAVTPFFFAAAARRLGSLRVNVVRLVMASCLLCAAVLATGTAQAIPARQAALLAASGVVGLALGDAALFEAFVILGPRRSSLLMATAPVAVVLLAIPLLGETLGPMGLLGMALTLGGVAWVVVERTPDAEVRGSLVRGTVYGVLSAVGQAVGVMLAKAGLGAAHADCLLGRLAAAEAPAQSASPLVGTTIRMLAGTATMVAFAAASGRMPGVREALRDRRGMALTAGGAFFGPTVGVFLSLVAIKFTAQAAVAQTIMALSPVFVIVIARAVHGERPSARAWIGSITAIGGLAVLALR